MMMMMMMTNFEVEGNILKTTHTHTKWELDFKFEVQAMLRYISIWTYIFLVVTVAGRRVNPSHIHFISPCADTVLLSNEPLNVSTGWRFSHVKNITHFLDLSISVWCGKNDDFYLSCQVSFPPVDGGCLPSAHFFPEKLPGFLTKALRLAQEKMVEVNSENHKGFLNNTSFLNYSHFSGAIMSTKMYKVVISAFQKTIDSKHPNQDFTQAKVKNCQCPQPSSCRRKKHEFFNVTTEASPTMNMHTTVWTPKPEQKPITETAEPNPGMTRTIQITHWLRSRDPENFMVYEK